MPFTSFHLPIFLHLMYLQKWVHGHFTVFNRETDPFPKVDEGMLGSLPSFRSQEDIISSHGALARRSDPKQRSQRSWDMRHHRRQDFDMFAPFLVVHLVQPRLDEAVAIHLFVASGACSAPLLRRWYDLEGMCVPENPPRIYRDLCDVGNKNRELLQTWVASTWALGVKISWKQR